MYKTGYGIEKNKDLARQWLTIAANNRSPSAIHELMSMDAEDFQEVMSDASYRSFLIKKAQDDDPKSQYLLGQAYLTGVGIEKNEELARQWILKSANNGYADAQYSASYLYLVSSSNKKDSYAFWEEWTRKAAENGHRFAAFNLGGMYEAGNSVSKDWLEAGRWYMYSASLGNANAMKRLNIMSDVCSRFPARNECKGFMLRDFALENDANDLYLIGLAFKDGDGIEQNYSKSLFWLKFAASKNHSEAQYELGDLYENALGVSRSSAQAKFWYEKAAAQGHKESAFRLKKLQESMEDK